MFCYVYILVNNLCIFNEIKFKLSFAKSYKMNKIIFNYNKGQICVSVIIMKRSFYDEIYFVT